MQSDNFSQQSDIRQTKIQSYAFVIAVCLCTLLSGFFSVLSIQRPGSSAKLRLENRINPNKAPVASLVRLPGIGVGRAAAIVDYRERLYIETGDGRAFKNCDDLRNVKGIGPKIAKSVCNWLRFEQD